MQVAYALIGFIQEKSFGYFRASFDKQFG